VESLSVGVDQIETTITNYSPGEVPVGINAEVHIRRAVPEDAGALARLLRSIGWFRRMENETEEQTIDVVSAELLGCLDDDSHSVYVAVSTATSDDSDVVAYVAVHWLPYLIKTGPEGFISELFVHERVRGHGLGTQLLDAVIAEAVARGCSRLQLINFRDRESYERGFYTKAGWEERPTAASFIYDLEAMGSKVE
jgi:GNAT superfamily N-acetyltransferase